MISGIYAIVNTKTGRRYIGSAVNFSKRWSRHRFDLERGSHQNSILQRSWNKHGAEVFDFVILEPVERDRLIEVEQVWLDRCWHEGLYNRRRKADSSLGVRHTPEECKRISERVRLRNLNPTPGMIAGRARQAEAIRGHKQSEETRARRSRSCMGRQVSEETRRKLSERPIDREVVARQTERITRNWIVTTPSGETCRVRNLKKFALENGLSQAHLSSVANGKRQSHKGYRVVRDPDQTHSGMNFSVALLL